MEARKVTEDQFWKYRQWAVKQELAAKSIYSHLVIIKQA